VTAAAEAGGLEADTVLEPLGDGRWRGTISERWWIERGPYGGYISALLVRALIAAVDDPSRLPRSLTVHFLDAPAAGPMEVAATVERRGGSATNVSLRMAQDGRSVALALGSAGAWREGAPEWADAEPPAVPGPDDCPAVPDLPELPAFMRNFDIRWAQGGGVGAPGHRARNVTWARPRNARNVPLDYIAVTALADTLVPAAFSRLGRPLIVPTLDLTIHFRAPLPAPGDADGWALVRFESRLAAGGLWEEDGEVWSRDGQLLAQSRQLAMIREPR
jgi:acyl-CoA thioesterase